MDTAPALERVRAALAQQCLSDFVKQAWHTFEPERTLMWGRHHDAICEYLEAVDAGQIRNLIITVAPRHTKSSIVSVAFPPWSWARDPSRQFLYASHDGSLAIEHSIKCRRVVESDWYLERWGARCTMAEDQNEKKKFENTAGGHRIATSVGGSVTGKGGDVLIVDDPHKAEEADSASLTGLRSAADWYDGTFSTRTNDPRKSARVIIGQRIHQGDLIGHVQKKGGYEHLDLQSIAEKRTVISMPRTGKDWVREEGDLLWPERFGKDELDDAKRDLGTWKFNSQHQQRTAAKAGGIFKRAWWLYYEELPKDLQPCVQSWDTAGKAKQQNDPSVCITGAENPKGFYLIDLWKGRVEFPELIAAANAQYAKHHPRVVLIEDKSSGISLTQSLERDTKIPVHPVGVDTDKVARANAISPTVQAGNVWIPEGAAWVADFVDELADFPNVIHDDQVDSFTQLMSFFLGFVKNLLVEPRIRLL